jgi:hypothetical protein
LLGREFEPPLLFALADFVAHGLFQIAFDAAMLAGCDKLAPCSVFSKTGGGAVSPRSLPVSLSPSSRSIRRTGSSNAISPQILVCRLIIYHYM